MYSGCDRPTQLYGQPTAVHLYIQVFKKDQNKKIQILGFNKIMCSIGGLTLDWLTHLDTAPWLTIAHPCNL